MRVLAITNMYPSPAHPGCGVFIEEQVKGLRAAGLKVRVLFIDRRREGAFSYFQMDGRVRNAIAEFQPDVIHVMYGGVLADRIVRRHHDRPVIVTFHGSDLLGENLSGWKRKLVSRLGVYCSRQSARRADGLIVVARHLLNALSHAGSRCPVRVIPCGIDLERFQPADTQTCRRRLGWNAGGFHVLFASSNGDPVKQPWLAEAAVEALAGAGSPVELHRLSGVSNAEVPDWLNASDALILTSKHEGSPTVVKEALACGLPVVSVDVGDVAERIEGIEGCHLAQPDPADLAEKLQWVRQRGHRLDCAPRLKELSNRRIAGRLKEFYETVAGTGGVSFRRVADRTEARKAGMSHAPSPEPAGFSTCEASLRQEA